MKRLAGLLLVAGSLLGAAAAAQDVSYSRRNTFEVFTEGSYTSSHILMGYSRNRQWLGIGAGYARRLLHSRGGDLSYLAEVRPVIFESDPFARTASEYITPLQGTDPPYRYETTYKTVAKCIPSSGVYILNSQERIVYGTACGRQRTYAQAFSPLGFKYSGRTHHPLQPFFAGTLGYMYANRPIPVENAGSFNFVFDFGPGLELYRGDQRSMSVEYRYHHFSNKGTAQVNPGVDNMMLKVSYNFGR